MRSARRRGYGLCVRALGIDIGGTSVKVAVMEGERAVCTLRSAPYVNPDAGVIVERLRGLMHEAGLSDAAVGAVGLCLPGLFDPPTRRLTRAVNVPRLVGVSVDEMLREALGGAPGGLGPTRVVSDAFAAGYDFALLRGLGSGGSEQRGRMLAISLGTGVGATVLDGLTPLRVSGETPGHLGQLDVTLGDGDAAPNGPDGARGTLEAYIGLPALTKRYGPDAASWAARLGVDEEPVRALIRAIRIGHAVYRPQMVALLGGVGLSLSPLAAAIRERVADGLTSVARPGWGLVCAEHAFHAACGAARLAGTAHAE